MKWKIVMNLLKQTKKAMRIFFTFIAILFIGIFVFFKIPYSKTQAEFDHILNETVQNIDTVSDVFSMNDIKDLPIPVQKYFTYCGYIGSPKMSYMKATFKNVKFVLTQDKPELNMEYTQYNFVALPTRLAYINTSMYYIPFQGIDSYVNGTGSTKGVFAKTITLFNDSGKELDKSCLVTVLSECLIIPNVAIQDYIVWESIDDTHAKATISYYGISASGIFTFSENGEMLSFTTNDRTTTESDGALQQVPWTATLSDYKTINGIKQPTILKATWHYENGDLVYFYSDNVTIEYFYGNIITNTH